MIKKIINNRVVFLAVVLAVVISFSFAVVANATLTFDAASVTGDGAVTINGAAASAITIGAAAQTGAISVGTSTGAMTLNLGTGNGAKTINVGTGTAIDTINIGTGGTGVDVIRIGDSVADIAITDAQWSITSPGAATFVTVNGNTITAGTGTLTLGAGSTLATSATNSVTLTSTGATNVTLPTTGTLATLAGTETFTNKTLISPTLTAPVLGVATGTSLATSAQNIFTATAATAPLILRSATATDDDINILPFAGGAGRFAGIITSADLTAARTYTFPDLTGTVVLSTNNLSIFAATTSAQLLGVLSDESGTGAAVFANTPTLVTPVLGAATATSVNKLTITTPATSATLTIADGKTLTASNTLTFTGTDTSSVAFGGGGTVAYTANNLSIFAATTSAQFAGVISDETGTGLVVLQTSPTLVTPVLGVATGTSLATSAQNIFTATAATAPVVARSATATDDDIRLLPQAGGAGRFAGIITTADLTADRTYTFPNSTGTFTVTGDNLSVFAATTSAQLLGVLSDETGTGAAVFANTPTLVTPVLGVATGTSLATSAQNIFTATAATAPLILRSATATDDDINILPFAGGAGRFAGIITSADLTAARTYTFPDLTGTVVLSTNNLSIFAATTSAQLLGVLSDESGTGAAVFANTPTLVTPVLGAATATSINLGGTTILDHLSATASIDIASIAAVTCNNTTITVTGAAAGDTVVLGPPSTIEANISWSGFVSAANTVSVRACNPTAAAIDPAIATWRADVWQH